MTRLVLIPSYNTGAKLFETVAEARRCWEPVWVVIDGSTDGTGQELMRRAEGDPGLRVFVRPRNEGKGAAILYGLRAARDAGYLPIVIGDACACQKVEQEAAAMQRINNFFAPVISADRFVELLSKRA